MPGRLCTTWSISAQLNLLAELLSVFVGTPCSCRGSCGTDPEELLLWGPAFGEDAEAAATLGKGEEWVAESPWGNVAEGRSSSLLEPLAPSFPFCSSSEVAPFVPTPAPAPAPVFVLVSFSRLVQATIVNSEYPK